MVGDRTLGLRPSCVENDECRAYVVGLRGSLPDPCPCWAKDCDSSQSTVSDLSRTDGCCVDSDSRREDVELSSVSRRPRPFLVCFQGSCLWRPGSSSSEYSASLWSITATSGLAAGPGSLLSAFSGTSEYPRHLWPFLTQVEHSGCSPAHLVFRLRHVKHLFGMTSDQPNSMQAISSVFKNRSVYWSTEPRVPLLNCTEHWWVSRCKSQELSQLQAIVAGDCLPKTTSHSLSEP